MTAIIVNIAFFCGACNWCSFCDVYWHFVIFSEYVFLVRPTYPSLVHMRKHGPAGKIVIGGNSWRDAAIARWGLAWRSHLDSECVFKYGIEEN